jgi:hypothetical protein
MMPKVMHKTMNSHLCLVPNPGKELEQSKDVSPYRREVSEIDIKAQLPYYLPYIAPSFSFIFYDHIVSLYHNFISFGKAWYSVDGGATETQLITPVINGIVLPSVSIILGTLIATTITSLRNRQISIRECLNKESSSSTISIEGVGSFDAFK